MYGTRDEGEDRVYEREETRRGSSWKGALNFSTDSTKLCAASIIINIVLGLHLKRKIQYNFEWCKMVISPSIQTMEGTFYVKQIYVLQTLV